MNSTHNGVSGLDLLLCYATIYDQNYAFVGYKFFKDCFMNLYELNILYVSVTLE